MSIVVDVTRPRIRADHEEPCPEGLRTTYRNYLNALIERFGCRTVGCWGEVYTDWRSERIIELVCNRKRFHAIDTGSGLILHRGGRYVRGELVDAIPMGRVVDLELAEEWVRIRSWPGPPSGWSFGEWKRRQALRV